ncbi:MAG: epoxyqueuosine reductase [Deltaproteobacteria bacterium]|nr:epoxyqueuosine reductase [Deltaproteobacteria bacterium]
MIGSKLIEFVESESRNALKEHGGIRMYDRPLVGFAAADDPWFDRFKEPGIIGPEFRRPGEWLEGARSVVSYFLPFTQAVRDSNRHSGMPSEGWLSSRIEGESFNDFVRTFLIGLIRGMGGDAVAPTFDPRYMKYPPSKIPLPARFAGAALWPGQFMNAGMTSNWSERHVAFAAGLGTFGLHRALISEKGCAGRYGSVVTTLILTPSRRKYKHPNEYCPYLTNGGCGACIERCPSGAITREGKNKEICNTYIETRIHALYVTRWGCAKCNLSVPCEGGIPKMVAKDVEAEM